MTPMSEERLSFYELHRKVLFGVDQNNMPSGISHFDTKELTDEIRRLQSKLAEQRKEIEELTKVLDFETKNHFRCHTRLNQLEQIDDHSRPDIHPEDICQECGDENPTWYAPNELWNEVIGSPNGIICPVCFLRKSNTKSINLIFTVERVGRNREKEKEAQL